MKRALLSNLGFEYELANRSLKEPVRKQQDRFAYILRLINGWTDAPAYTGGIVDDLLAWGLSASAREASPAAAMSWPSLEVVQRVNDKCFSHDVEVELGIELRGSCVVHSVAEFASAVARCPGRWLLKHPFGVAGRETARGETIDESARAAVGRLFRTSSRLLFEPEVRITSEFSVHFDVQPNQAVDLVGGTELLTDARGTHRGNATSSSVPGAIVDTARRAAGAVAAAGYYGPLGIDTFVGELGGREISRPLCEFNARWSFGRLALELATWLHREVVWHHGADRNRPSSLRAAWPRCPPGFWLLPAWCDPDGHSGTWIEVGEKDA